jgi:3-oxoacyl-[acyl-carrier protein] reductase
MLDFTNKNVVVTGGSRGIGAAAVKLFARLNANVSFNYHSNQTAADAVMNQINSFGGKYIAEKCDISDPNQIKLFVDNTLNTFSSIDILVNNAGIWEYGAIDTMSAEEWLRTIRINLDSVFYFTQLVVSAMKKAKSGGRIINIASTAGQRGEAFHSHYAASKGAIISFTKSLATELGPDDILVNCVAPGWVDTDMSHEAILETGEKIRDLIPLNKIPGADELAGPIVFLASDWATAITGEILNVNSGSVLCG